MSRSARPSSANSRRSKRPVRQQGLTLRFEDSDFRENRVFFADESFFRVFTVAFISGDLDAALRDPDAVVLTEPTARRYFRDRDPVGRTLLTGDGRLLRVTGVVKPFPESSHFHFDMLGSLRSLPIIQQRETNWGSGTVYTYLVLRPGEEPAGLTAKLQAYIDANVAAGDSRATGDYWRYELQPLRDIHLRSHLPYELEANGATEYVYLFSVVAFLILLLACVNYVNLATARSMARAREVGIRKVRLGPEAAPPAIPDRIVPPCPRRGRPRGPPGPPGASRFNPRPGAR